MTRWLLAILCALGLAACGGEEDLPPPPPLPEAPAISIPEGPVIPDNPVPETPAVPPPTLDPVKPVTKPDGPVAPSLEIDWGPMEILAFDIYLSKQAYDYPKAGSGAEGALFAKLLASTEQPVLTDATIPLEKRTDLALVMFQAINNLMARYAAAHELGFDYSVELSELLGVILSAGRQLFVVVDEIMPTLDKDSEDYAYRMRGLEKVKSGMATVLGGVLLSLRETEIYTDGERLVIAKSLVAHGPDLLGRLEKDAQERFRADLKRTTERESSERVREILTSFPAD